jgi:hypothetical protein
MKLSLCVRLGSAALVPLLLTFAADARADDPPAVEAGEPSPSPPSFAAPQIAPQADSPRVPVERRFGRAGQVVLSSNFGLSGSSTRYSNSGARFSGLTVGPGIDLFILDHLSIGLDLTFTRADSTGYAADGGLYTASVTQLSAGARVAMDVPLGAHLSWWPRLTVGCKSTHEEEPLPSGPLTPDGGAPATGVTNARGAFVVVYAPLLVHPAPHFFVGFGPVMARDLGRTASVAVHPVHDQTSLGAYALVGGWL